MLLIPGTGNGELGTGTGNGEPGTGVWEQVYSGNPLENSNGGQKSFVYPSANQTLLLQERTDHLGAQPVETHLYQEPITLLPLSKLFLFELFLFF